MCEELKQRIKAKAAKLKRYQNRINQFRQNRLFQTDQGKLYKELNGNETENLVPDKEEARTFWEGIWRVEARHNNEAEWLENIRREKDNLGKQEKTEISSNKLKKIMKNIPNWKSPGPDLVQRFWIKKLHLVA